ncbi:MAG: DUF1631 family protein [Halieaceae bacterium]|jgi:diguanylate cyclase (GGDEF)-like protein|nr:DUF1631 family protein [Halieaceae bacterium]
MSEARPSRPAYLSFPDGLRFAGTARASDGGLLSFSPKQLMSPVPPDGLPVHLTVAGLGEDEEGQATIAATVDHADARELLLEPDDQPPRELFEALAAPDAAPQMPAAEAEAVLNAALADGKAFLASRLKRFTLDLGDHLFDLSTSSKYGPSGKHDHYDALNALKRRSEQFQEQVLDSIAASLEQRKKKEEDDRRTDLESASAHNLDLVDLEEMDLQIAVDKSINEQIERHRVSLECLTIRAALAAGIEPPQARTPFHPAFIVQAFVDAFSQMSPSMLVLIDGIRFFREQYLPALEALYRQLNEQLIAAGIEPDLEQEIRENGSLLHPVEKRIVKSSSRDTDDAAEFEAEDTPNDRDDGPARAASTSERRDSPSRRDDSASAEARSSDAFRDSASHRAQPGEMASPAATAPRDKHDAMYEAVVRALDTSRGGAPGRAPDFSTEGSGVAADESPGARGTPPDSTASSHAPGPASAPTSAGDGDTPPDAGSPLSEAQLGALLQQLQQSHSPAPSLADLPPLEDLVRELSGRDDTVLDRDGANRLGFIDNVFRTLHRNFEVSADMAPTLARLRVPLARLSLQEPRFFAQPEHPAHQVLDKLSMLAGADKSSNRALQNKLATIVDAIAHDYDGGSEVFARARGELDKLLSQQGRVLERNIERVVKGLEGQERLARAQRRVEELVTQQIDPESTPRALLELLEGGWRSAMVQLALREGEDSGAWKEEAALLEQLLSDLKQREDGALATEELREMQLRLRALNKRLNASNPGSVSHENPLRELSRVLSGEIPLQTSAYSSPLPASGLPDSERVEQLPRLRRWLERVKALEPGARLRYVNKEGQRRRMRLVWVSDDRDRFAFVNERGQKVAELTAVQLARQLSRGAQPPTRVDNMSVLHQSMYETLEQAQKTLSFERNRDRVTKLINADSLVNQLRRTLRHAHAHDSEHAYLALDIDNFALVNDVFDETSGDEVLAAFGQLLGQLHDQRALSARMREDEFGILLTYSALGDARRVADKIRGDIAESGLTVAGESVSFTVSIGIAPILRSTASPQQVLEQSRSALQIAKDQGRDQVVVYDVDQEEIHRYQRERANSRQLLDEAMDTDRLVLRAQPLVQTAVDGSEQASHHYEVLLALRDDDGELQSPQDFIRSAERFGFVTLVDRWVVRQTFAWISKLVDRQKQVPQLAINLSGTSITDNEFLEYILEQISEYGVGTSRLCFEITETGAIDNLAKAADFVRTLKNIGCLFSLDDFGTGLASHKYLKELPVDYVKIDGTFISDIHNNSTDYAMAKSINDLAHFLGQKTIAECVETLEIVPSLREIGVDYLQGWGVGMPRELDEIFEELPDLET